MRWFHGPARGNGLRGWLSCGPAFFFAFGRWLFVGCRHVRVLLGFLSCIFTLTFSLPCLAREPMVWVVENAPEEKTEAKDEAELGSEPDTATEGTEGEGEEKEKKADKKKTEKKAKKEEKEQATKETGAEEKEEEKKEKEEKQEVKEEKEKEAKQEYKEAKQEEKEEAKEKKEKEDKEEKQKQEKKEEKGEIVFVLRDKQLMESFLAANPVEYLPWEDGSGCQIGIDGTCITTEGLLHAEPCLHYMKWTDRGGRILSGFYYHDESGFLQQLGEEVDLSAFSCREAIFPGLTPVGVLGKVEPRPGICVYPDLAELAARLDRQMDSLPGTWAFCIKNLDTGQEVSRGEGAMVSASMIKLFAMEAVYARMEEAGEEYEKKYGLAPGDLQVLDGLYGLLENMVCFSDNESFNELVRLVGGGDFSAGAKVMTDYLKGHGYGDTLLGHTLHPSDSEEEGTQDENHTSPKDCVLLLSRIYEGACKGDAMRLSMLRFLMMQDTLHKIPAGLPEGVLFANKTGETDDLQHDAALIYGKEATLVLCIFSFDCPEEEAVEAIQEMTRMVVEFEGI